MRFYFLFRNKGTLLQVYTVDWQQADGKPIRFRTEDTLGVEHYVILCVHHQSVLPCVSFVQSSYCDLQFNLVMNCCVGSLLGSNKWLLGKLVPSMALLHPLRSFILLHRHSFAGKLNT